MSFFYVAGMQYVICNMSNNICCFKFTWLLVCVWCGGSGCSLAAVLRVHSEQWFPLQHNEGSVSVSVVLEQGPLPLSPLCSFLLL